MRELRWAHISAFTPITSLPLSTAFLLQRWSLVMLAFAPFTNMFKTKKAKKRECQLVKRKPSMEIKPDALDKAGDDILPPSVAEEPDLHAIHNRHPTRVTVDH